MDVFAVELSAKAKKDLKRVPTYIVDKLIAWIDCITQYGLQETKKVPGFHDEPLKGKRKGQRSIRLSKAYRAFYIIGKSGEFHFAEVLEVNKHEY